MASLQMRMRMRMPLQMRMRLRMQIGMRMRMPVAAAAAPCGLRCRFVSTRPNDKPSENHWKERFNTKTVWAPLPITAVLVGLGTLHLVHKWRRGDFDADTNAISGRNSQTHVDDSAMVQFYLSLPLRSVSRIWGWLSNLTVPTMLRPAIYGLYSYAFGCNLDEMRAQSLKDFPTLAAFFYRDLKEGARPIAEPKDGLVLSPADGKVLHLGRLDINRKIEQIKGITYSVDDLLGKSPVSATTDLLSQHDCVQTAVENTPPVVSGNNIYFAVVYLAPGDYHRFHSPVDWSVSMARHIAGELLSVSPKVASLVRNLFVLNERVVLMGNWKHGMFSMVPVGATNVGSIVVNALPDLKTNLSEQEKPLGVYDLELPGPDRLLHLRRGEEVGGFRLGSTVVLVFEAPDAFEFTVAPGDHVRMGLPLGYLSE